ncbi:MAG: DUF3786 domain-containing protein [Deltaproteobacteria bacterium]|jgi:hypothetical protein|nr:DUF3786 domain-containing protein [Deltaproteobacteria bacterium]
MSRTKNSAARIAYCERQLENLARVDIRAQAEAMGLAADEAGKTARARFLGREYLISNEGVRDAEEGRNVPVDTQSVLAHYIASRGRGEASLEFVPIGRLTGLASGASAGTSPSDQLFKPLADKFGPDYEAFRKAALALGAKHVGLSQAGAQSFVFDGLPKLPVRAEFFEADEEFGAEIKILFSSNATVFVMYEVLELTIMSLVVALLLEAGLISCPDDCQASFI